ncbi:MAG TPA: Crp/Fnr family transcriptional regulator [Stellaceae bacterium]|nr:Crp/Fnr family transcriptional regulator [Stellaceae bacterium]
MAQPDIIERPAELLVRPHYADAVKEQLLLGGAKLRTAFMQTPMRFAGREARLLAAGESDLGAVLVRSGFAYRSCVLADGRRAILDILLTGDVSGIDHAVLMRPIDEIRAAARVGYHVLGAGSLRELMRDPNVATTMIAMVAEARWRAYRIAAALGRLDAQARLCVLLLDIHDRLHRNGLIFQPTYNLPLTQEQIADYLGLTLVHVNRTLRRLRERKIALLDHQVVIIMDLERLRQCAQGLPQAPERLEAAFAAGSLGS